MVRQYKATETAFVEWVLGNPYSRAVRPDIVMRCNGGLSGLETQEVLYHSCEEYSRCQQIDETVKVRIGDEGGESRDDLHTIAGCPIQCSIGSPMRKKVCVL